MSGAKKQILEMLSIGLQPTQVASSLGVSESYISQLLGDDEFASELEEKRVASAQEDIEYDNQIDKVEGTFLDNIEKKSQFANLQQSLQAFAILNKAKRRKDSVLNRGAPKIGTIVQITLNATHAPQYIINGKSEIVEVEGRTMVSATPKKLDEILALRAGNGNGKSAERLPGITKVERADGKLREITNQPIRRMPKMLPANLEVSDIL